ncbi:hypothetical protein AFK62_02630 [Cronobacter condimenti 1330]|uniref:Uncharacterized protein n=1 Tax=Cronobacter condimenti 1330 TaxID=1073999 RepID=A0ABM5V911_9ENTR|nr:hypothetical protein AFK62_02630 [Cronobacter condimenti 1330]
MIIASSLYKTLFHFSVLYEELPHHATGFSAKPASAHGYRVMRYKLVNVSQAFMQLLCITLANIKRRFATTDCFKSQ